MWSKFIKNISTCINNILLMIVIISAVSGLAACKNGTQDSIINSGIKGIAIIGPLQPVSRPGETNEKPYPDAIIIIKSLPDNKEIARTKVKADGTFIIKLPVGRYELESVNPTGSSLPFAQPIQVDVAAGKYTDVTVNFDSGIR